MLLINMLTASPIPSSSCLPVCLTGSMRHRLTNPLTPSPSSSLPCSLASSRLWFPPRSDRLNPSSVLWFQGTSTLKVADKEAPAVTSDPFGVWAGAGEPPQPTNQTNEQHSNLEEKQEPKSVQSHAAHTGAPIRAPGDAHDRSEEHTSELQSQR